MFKGNIFNRMKLFLCLVLTLCFLSNSVIFADDQKAPPVINMVVSLNISSGIVSGDSTGYQINLPEDVIKHLQVERVLLRERNTIVEKVNYYCVPPSKKYKPALICTFYVFYKHKWGEEYMLTPIMTTKDYIYAVKIYEENSFEKTDVEDRQIYNFLLKKFANPTSIKNSISLSRDQKILTENALSVNGVVLNEKAKVIDSVYYLPLRAVCESLGYKVSWYKSSGNLSITKDDYFDSFNISNSSRIPGGGNLTIINGRTYVSTRYFLTNLGCSIEVDENGNVNVMT